LAFICDANAHGAPAPSNEKERTMTQRRRFKQEETLEQRLSGEAAQLREAAESLRPGAVRDAAIRKARQMEAASSMNEWLSSSGLPPSE
jgi:hypothetical protein